MDNKPYNDLNTYLKNRFGTKVYKLALSGGMTCPNRDGTKGFGGCAFCSEGGSGDFAEPFLGEKPEDITRQINFAKERIKKKVGLMSEGCQYIAYFQSFTNTYASVDYLETLFRPAINHSQVCALSIATRPDCITDEVVDLLAGLNRVKPVWVELGLQTIHKNTMEEMNLCYGLTDFDNAVSRLKSAGIEVIVHLIIGLPGESKEDILESVKYVAAKPIDGIKLQLLHIMSETRLGIIYQEDTGIENRLCIRSSEDYINLLEEALMIIPGNIVIHRLTGDAPRNKLLYPKWSGNKRIVLNGIYAQMKKHGTVQGLASEKGLSNSFYFSMDL